jgi:hypothetical protein
VIIEASDVESGNVEEIKSFFVWFMSRRMEIDELIVGLEEDMLVCKDWRELGTSIN